MLYRESWSSMTLPATYPPTAAPRKRLNSGNLLKRDWNTWPEDSTTRTTCLSSFPTVSKLELMPIDTWHRLSKDRKDIDIHSIKTVDISSSANQSGGSGGSMNAPLLPLDPPALLEGSVVVRASSLSPPSLPPPLPTRRRGKGRRGNPCTLIEKIWARRRHPVR